MTSQPVLVTERDGVVTIELNRSERLNAVNTGMVEALLQALREAQRRGARAVVLTGAGSSFCSGHDLREPVADDGPDDTRRRLETLQDVTRALKSLPCPVVAAVEGYAVGAGAEFAFACDLVVAGREAVFAFPEVSVGLAVTNGITQLLAAVLGPQRAKYLLLTGERFGPQQAHEWGLISLVTDRGTARAQADALARRLAAQPPTAVTIAKRGVDRGFGAGLEESLALEVELSMLLDPGESGTGNLS